MSAFTQYATRLILASLLWVLPAGAQSSDEDDFKLARNLFRDAGDYATSSTLFAEFIRNYPNSPQLAEARLMLARSLYATAVAVHWPPAPTRPFSSSTLTTWLRLMLGESGPPACHKSVNTPPPRWPTKTCSDALAPAILPDRS